jgi:hypothetical protein
MSGNADQVIQPVRATNTVVVLTETRGGSTVESRVFDSVAAAAVYFAHVAIRAWMKTKLSGDALIEAVAAETAVLFAGYDNTTGEDKDTIQLNGVRYEAKLTAVLDEALASADGQALDAGEDA